MTPKTAEEILRTEIATAIREHFQPQETMQAQIDFLAQSVAKLIERVNEFQGWCEDNIQRPPGREL